VGDVINDMLREAFGPYAPWVVLLLFAIGVIVVVLAERRRHK
jgi:hypothetical protein